MRVKKSKKNSCKSQVHCSFNSSLNPQKNKTTSEKLMLSEIRNIYNDENERNKNLENKASIGITLLGVLITVGISELSIDKVIKVRVNNFGQIVLHLILLILLVLMISMLVLTVYNFCQSIKTRPYNRMSTGGFIEKNTEFEEQIIAKVIISQYVKIINNNRDINNEKSKFIDKGLIYLIICIVAYVIYSLIYKFI